MKHGTNGAYNRGCRCDECSSAHAEYGRQYRRNNPDKVRAARERAKETPFCDIPHGTYTSHNYYGCRCDECQAAYKRYMEDTKDRRREYHKGLAQTPFEDVAHGTYYGYSKLGCRCPSCTEARREYSRQYYQDNREKVLARQSEYAARKRAETAWGDIPHGTVGGYGLYGCRCEECRAIKSREHYHKRKERLKQIPFENIPHGTLDGYNSYGCRCEECRAIKAEKARAYYRAAKSRSENQDGS